MRADINQKIKPHRHERRERHRGRNLPRVAHARRSRLG